MSDRYEMDLSLVYITAQGQNYTHIVRLLPAYTTIAAAMEMQTTQHLSIFYPAESDLLSDPSPLIDQAHMLQTIYAAIYEDLIQGSKLAQQARIRAVAAPGAGAWLHAPPPPRQLETWCFLILHFLVLSVCDWECRFLVRARDIIIVVRRWILWDIMYWLYATGQQVWDL